MDAIRDFFSAIGEFFTMPVGLFDWAWLVWWHIIACGAFLIILLIIIIACATRKKRKEKKALKNQDDKKEKKDRKRNDDYGWEEDWGDDEEVVKKPNQESESGYVSEKMQDSASEYVPRYAPESKQEQRQDSESDSAYVSHTEQEPKQKLYEPRQDDQGFWSNLLDEEEVSEEEQPDPPKTATVKKSIPVSVKPAVPKKSSAPIANNEDDVAPAKGGKYIITKNSEGKYVFTLCANNGIVLYESDGYVSPTGAKAGIQNFKKHISNAEFEGQITPHGDCVYLVKRGNGSYTSKLYDDETKAKAAFMSLKRFHDTDNVVIKQRSK